MSDADGLAPVTFDELATMVQARVKSSRATTTAGRRLLLDLIEELRSARSGATSARLLGPSGWQLARIAVQGFGGIGNAAAPLVLDIPTGECLIAIRGQNGTGKTSLVAALDIALGVDRPSHAASLRNPLWQADRVTDGAAEGTVEVRLVRGSDTLVISGRCQPGGATIREARLLSEGREEPVELGREWVDAVVAANASFTYAGLQDRLREDVDLQSYLEELLLLGPIWHLVHQELDERAAAAEAARKSLDKLQAAAQVAERELYDRFAADPRQPIPPPLIQWPRRWSEDVDDWLEVNQLVAAVPLVRARVADGHLQQAAELIRQLDAAWNSLDDAQAQLARPELAAVLDQIEALVMHTELGDGRCPVCDEPSDWRTAAASALGQVKDRNRRVIAVRGAVSRLGAWVERELHPLLVCGIEGGPVAAVHTFQEVLRRDGTSPRPDLRSAVDELAAALVGPAYGEWLSRIRAASDAQAEWRAARRESVADLVDAWRERGKIAADAADWKVATKTLTELQRDERQRRQDRLTARLQDAVARLLPDAGIEFGPITHRGGAKQKRGVSLDLTIGGRRATLGMLSSGQRNALLLASLLCIGPPAPFGFVVIDDPVHALDDLRVDRLARELTRLATDRQVVVLTHDARLEEHLRIRCPTLHMRVLDRDPASATVRAKIVTSPWDQLLDQAAQLLDAVDQDRWRAEGPVTSVVGGLCRNALDGALRHAVLAHAARSGSDVVEAIKDFDKAGRTTRKRALHVIGLAGGREALPRTAFCLDQYLGGWNAGTHGAARPVPELRIEIRHARRTCKELTAWTG